MNEIINYIIIGVLQGTIEWLPISSQGNLVIYLANFLKISPQLSLNYSLLLHIGTLGSAIVYFRNEIKEIFSIKNIKLLIVKNFNLIKIKEEKEDENFLIARFLLISLIVTFFISGPLYFLLRQKSSDINVSFLNLTIGILLIATGFLIFYSNKKTLTKPKLTIMNSFILGLSQGFAIIPGLSRSGLTTSALLFRGFTPEKAFRLSFLLSIPTIFFGEIALFIFNGIFFSPYIIISIIVSFVVGYFTIDFLLKFAKKINFSYFCFVLGFLYILSFLI